MSFNYYKHEKIYLSNSLEQLLYRKFSHETHRLAVWKGASNMAKVKTLILWNTESSYSLLLPHYYTSTTSVQKKEKVTKRSIHFWLYIDPDFCTVTPNLFWSSNGPTAVAISIYIYIYADTYSCNEWYYMKSSC